jgi:D-3-phosphoglycerate dehydrogenase
VFRAFMAANDEGPLPDWLLQSFDDEGIDFFYHECVTPQEVVEVGSDADVIWIMTPLHIITDYSLSRLSNCVAVVRSGSGTDNVDVDAATREGIVIANTPGAVTETVSDHTVAMLFSVVRRIPYNDRDVRAGGWREESSYIPHHLTGGTLGLVGFGRIGRRVAEKVSGFSMKVLAFDPYVPDDVMSKAEVEKVALDDLLQRSDFVSLHTPLTTETFHLIGERQLRLMRPNAYLVNVARGAVVDEPALYRALSEGWIAGAALDVLEVYPPDPDNPLLRLEDVVFNPHIAAAGVFCLHEMFRLAGETIIDVRHGRWPRSVVNPTVKPRRPLMPRS